MDRKKFMREHFINYLVCPLCKESFEYEIIEYYRGHIMDGYLYCRSCSSRYPIKKGVPIIVDSVFTDIRSIKLSKRFSYQWTKFSDLNDFYQEQFKKWITPLDEKDFIDKIVLDGGCGKGRHLYFVSKWGAKAIFGVDLSFESTLVAFNNTKDLNNVVVLCADLNNLPFRTEFFDIIYSVGVIHHTPEPKKTFENITRYLKKNGIILIWVYAKEPNKFITSVINPFRKYITSKLSLPLVNFLSFIIAFFLFILLKLVYLPFNKIYFLKPFSRTLLYNSYFSYISKFPFKEIWCIVFDHLIPQISHYLRYDEIKSWYEDMSIDVTNISLVNGVGWSFCGTQRKFSKD